MVAKVLDDDSNADVAEKFYEALGSGKADGCRTWRVDAKTGEREFLGKRSITNDDFDLFIRLLQDDYPRGGKYIFSLVDANNKVIGNSSIVLGPLPDAQQPRAERPAAPATNNMDMMTFMMQQQQRADEERRRSDERSAQRFELILGGIVTVAAKALPEMFKGGGNKGESAGELLNMLLDAKEKIMPREGEDPFDKTLDRMAKMKTVMGSDDKDAGGDGLIGLASKFMPGLLQLATTQAAQPAPGLPAPQPRPAVAAPADNPVDKFRPLMEAVKVLLARQEAPGMIATYIDMQLRVGAVSASDLTALFDQVAAAPQIFLPTLGMYGITTTAHAIAIATAIALINGVQDGDELQHRWAAYGITPGPEHTALVATCVSYFAVDVDDDDEETGMGGDSSGLGTHGPDGGGGIDPAANPTLGLEPHATVGTA